MLKVSYALEQNKSQSKKLTTRWSFICSLPRTDVRDIYVTLDYKSLGLYGNQKGIGLVRVKGNYKEHDLRSIAHMNVSW